MKVLCEKSEFLKGIQTVANVISSKTTLPILSHILLDAAGDRIQLYATNLEVGIRTSVRAEVIEEGGITVPGRMISDIVREVPEDKMEVLTETKARMVISCGKSFFKIMGLPKEEFPKIPELEGKGSFSISCGTVKEFIRKTSFAVSKDEIRPGLSGILLKVRKGEMTVVSTDGRRLAKFKKSISDKEIEKVVILPSKAVNEVNRIMEDGKDEVKIAVGENEVMFEFGKIMLVTRLVKERFPDYERVVPKTYSVRLSLEREVFLSAVRRVSLLTSEKSSAIKISLSRNKMALSASTSELGEASDEIDISYDGEEEILAFFPVYLMDFLRNETCKEVYFDIINSVSPAVLRPVGGEEDYLYVIMPIKI